MLLYRNRRPNQLRERVKTTQEGYNRRCKGATDRSSRTRSRNVRSKRRCAKSQNQRDARGRFIGKSGSKAAAEDARAERAERAEKARRKEDDERLNAESGLLKNCQK